MSHFIHCHSIANIKGHERGSHPGVLNLNILSRFRNRTVYTVLPSKFSRLASCFGGLRGVLGFSDSSNNRIKIFRRYRWAAFEANERLI